MPIENAEPDVITEETRALMDLLRKQNAALPDTPTHLEIDGQLYEITGSFTANGDEWEPDEVPAENQFCATGEGGGIDPSCGSGKAAPTSPPKSRVEAARAKFDALHQQYQATITAAHAAGALKDKNKTSSPDDWAKGHLDAAKVARNQARITHEAVTEKNAPNAVDETGYRSARERHKKALDDKSRAEVKFNQMLYEDGVRGKQSHNSLDSYSAVLSHLWGEEHMPPEKLHEKMTQSYTGVDPNKVAHYLEEAKSIKEKGDHAFKMQNEWQHPYYGEPDQVRNSHSTELGPVSPDLPPKVVHGGAEKEVKEFMSQAVVAMQMKIPAFEKVASSKTGEFKNGYQGAAVGSVGKGKSGYFVKRKEAEEEVYGIPKSAEAKDRPIYGYLEHPDRMESDGAHDIGSNYGPVQVVFKHDVKQRTSYTVGDSLDDRQLWGRYSGAVNDPASIKFGESTSKTNPSSGEVYPTLAKDQYAGPSTSEWGGKYIGTMYHPTYMEAQMHGGLSLKDVAEVRIPKDVETSDKALKGLEKAGVKVVRTPPRHVMLYSFGFESADQMWRKKAYQEDS
jgi:hypothetical protein